MHLTDKNILHLITVLTLKKQVLNMRDFCNIIKMREQTITKIKNGSAHFTVLQIESICKIFKVNANWIYGIELSMFLKKVKEYSNQELVN